MGLIGGCVLDLLTGSNQSLFYAVHEDPARTSILRRVSEPQYHEVIVGIDPDRDRDGELNQVNERYNHLDFRLHERQQQHVFLHSYI